MKIKYAFKGISRNIILTFLIIVQLVLVFNLIYINLDLEEKVSNESLLNEVFFSNKHVYYLMFGDDIGNFLTNPQITEKDLKKSFNYIESLSGCKFIQIAGTGLPIEKFEGYEEFKLNPAEHIKDGVEIFNARNYIINENFLKEYNINLESGRIFKKEEFIRGFAKENVLPIIVGSNYKRYFNLGDEILYRMTNDEIRRAQIIGIIKKDQFIPGNLNSENDRYIHLDNCILTTDGFIDDDKYAFLHKFINNYIFFDNNISNSDMEVHLYNIEDIFYNNSNLKVKTWNLNNKKLQEINIFKDQRKIVLVTCITIIIFISITLFISALNSINKRKKEFYIHIFNGGSLKDIAEIMYLQILLVLFISYLISIPIIYTIQRNLNFKILFISFLVLFIISICIAIIPVSMILKFSIIELMKEGG
ncbi:hypothetical protein DP130_07160 [Clostridium tetani]|uniref:ABC transporter permease n=1 Tax=Clostridium tetani TaxID=1513 RepID=A0A4Q0VB32_CLOTA|nr:FtsX-like permease family protein [Clostridium tetani]RXI48503.1 hypothetical protein DP130_07160 [Clostridium tetani]